MAGMFVNATTFNQDISSWNTSNVTNMNQFFQNSSAFQGALASLDFAKVTNLNNFMNAKIAGNSYNTTNYDLLLQRWNDQVINDAMVTTITTNMGGAKYNDLPSAGGVARAALITAGWTIVDGGAV
jgi:surface protein